MLSVRNGAKAVEFRKAAFAALELFRLDDRDRAVVARFSVEGAEFRVADESPQHLNFSPESLGGGTVRRPPSFGPSATTMAGAWDELSIRSGLGNRQRPWPRALEVQCQARSDRSPACGLRAEPCHAFPGALAPP